MQPPSISGSTARLKPVLTLKHATDSNSLSAFCQCQNGLLASAGSGKLCFWDLRNATCVSTWKTPTAQDLLCPLTNGNLAVVKTSSDAVLISIWNPGCEALVRTVRLTSLRGRVSPATATLQLDDRRLAVARRVDGIIEELDIETRRSRTLCETRYSFIEAFHHADTSMFVSSGKRITVVCTNQGSLKPIHSFEAKSMVTCICGVSKTRFIGGGRDQIRVWDLETKEDAPLGKHLGVNTLCLLDSSLMASGAQDGSIKIWNLNDKACICTLKQHKDPIIGFCKIKEEPLFASASGDGEIKIWRIDALGLAGKIQARGRPAKSKVTNALPIVAQAGGSLRKSVTRHISRRLLQLAHRLFLIDLLSNKEALRESNQASDNIQKALVALKRGDNKRAVRKFRIALRLYEPVPSWITLSPVQSEIDTCNSGLGVALTALNGGLLSEEARKHHSAASSKSPASALALAAGLEKMSFSSCFHALHEGWSLSWSKPKRKKFAEWPRDSLPHIILEDLITFLEILTKSGVEEPSLWSVLLTPPSQTLLDSRVQIEKQSGEAALIALIDNLYFDACFQALQNNLIKSHSLAKRALELASTQFGRKHLEAQWCQQLVDVLHAPVEVRRCEFRELFKERAPQPPKSEKRWRPVPYTPWNPINLSPSGI